MATTDPDFDLFRHFDLEADEPHPVTAARPPAADTADGWDRFCGNTHVLAVLKAFVVYPRPGRHILVHGPNRSGKTFMTHTALKAKFCRDRRPDLSPCGRCPSCVYWNNSGRGRIGCYRNQEGHDFRYYPIDGTNPATFDEDLVCFYTDHRCPLVLFVDEVAHPEFLRLMPRLIKPMTETPVTIVACGVRLGPRKDPVTGQKSPGLSKDFVYRFAAIERTTAPARPDFLRWLTGEARRSGFEADEATLSLIIDRAGEIPGQALRPLMKAELMQVPLTRQFVEGFRWDVA